MRTANRKTVQAGRGDVRRPLNASKRASVAVVNQDLPAVTVTTRVGKKLISGFFSPETHTRFKVLAAREQKTQQLLLEEALDLLFERRDPQ